MEKWYRVHAIERSWAVCKDCTGKTPLESAEVSKVCPFCKNRGSRGAAAIADSAKKMGVEINGAIDRIEK